MSISMEIYAEYREDGQWKAANIGADGVPEILFDAGSNNHGLYGILARMPGRPWPRPIAPARGIPDDCSDQVRRLAEADRELDPSPRGGPFSWLLLSEILAYDWEQEAFLVYLRDGWAYLEGVTEEEATAWRDANDGVQVTRESISHLRLPDHVLSELRSYGEPEDVRVVFWFVH